MANKKTQERVSQPPKEAPSVPQSQDGNTALFAMLEALADAMESKADAILESGNEQRAELRSMFLKDVAGAIRDRFGAP